VSSRGHASIVHTADEARGQSPLKTTISSEHVTKVMISPTAFYDEYYGHDIGLLESLHGLLRQHHGGKKKFVWLIGDSSLDNKYWLRDRSAACNGYEKILSRPHSIQDVCFWVNKCAVDRNLPYCCINGAVEESTLEQRNSILNSHDRFVRDSMIDGDVLVCSVGGNDIALKPTPSTIWNMLLVVKFASVEKIADGTAWGMSYLIGMFRDKIQNYLERVVGSTKCSKVLVCMIYYPALVGEGWADMSLSFMNYTTEKDPERLQLMIRTAFEMATSEIRIAGIDDEDVIPVPLFEILDPMNAADYVARVEPSSLGGRKMATKFLDAMETTRSQTQRDGFWKFGAKT
jgi:hypothetical protein